MAAYLTLVSEGGDSAELAHALGIVARARNDRDREASGLTREALYKALLFFGGDGHPAPDVSGSTSLTCPNDATQAGPADGPRRFGARSWLSPYPVYRVELSKLSAELPTIQPKVLP